MSISTDELNAASALLEAKLAALALDIASLEHRIATDQRREQLAATRNRRRAVYMLALHTLAHIRAYGSQVVFSSE